MRAGMGLSVAWNDDANTHPCDLGVVAFAPRLSDRRPVVDKMKLVLFARVSAWWAEPQEEKHQRETNPPQRQENPVEKIHVAPVEFEYAQTTINRACTRTRTRGPSWLGGSEMATRHNDERCIASH